ncbi:hypothetical protein D3C85_1274930 [compost metagenome]
MDDLGAAGMARHRDLAHTGEARLVGDEGQQVVQHLERADAGAGAGHRVFAADPALHGPDRHVVEMLGGIGRAGEVRGNQQHLFRLAAAGLEQRGAGRVVIVAIALEAVLHEHHLADAAQVRRQQMVGVDREIIAGTAAQVHALPLGRGGGGGGGWRGGRRRNRRRRGLAGAASGKRRRGGHQQGESGEAWRAGHGCLLGLMSAVSGKTPILGRRGLLVKYMLSASAIFTTYRTYRWN